VTLARVEHVETIPVAYPLPAGATYGSARGRVRARQATLVRLVTTDGAVGWGEAFGSPAAVRALVAEAAETLRGRSLDAFGPWFTRYLQQSYHLGVGGAHVAAASGLDLAMWDALGKTLGMSVGRLLGGRARDTVTAYASTGYVTEGNDLGEFSDAVARAVHKGFPGAKVKLGLGLEEDRRRAEAARAVLGDDRELMVDFNGNYTADQAVRVVRALAGPAARVGGGACAPGGPRGAAQAAHRGCADRRR
jgi:D-galactarolactone cycloisomerase